jgi:hypothetical protein
MRADHFEVGRRNPHLLQHGCGGISEAGSDDHVHGANPRHGVLLVIVEAQQLRPDILRIGHRFEGQQLDRCVLRMPVDAADGDVDAVQRRSGDKPNADIAHEHALAMVSVNAARVMR